jgi:hypothetical protein
MADIMPSQTISPGFDPAFAEAEGMIAPGQEEMAKQFMDGEPETQPEAEPQNDLIGGKFNTQDDLLKAYRELEKKQSQTGPPTQQPDGYSAEQATEVYGNEIVNSVNEAGLNMAELMWKADNGGDISEHYDALASAVGVPRQVVENYVSKAQAGESESAGMSEVEEAQIVEEVGGQQAFQELSGWAKTNLDPAELSDYNGIVDSGNKQAIRWALKAMQARSTGGAASEPKLIRGQAPATQARKFNSQSEVLEAMNKRDSRGRKLYETDSEYQRKFAELLNNSDVFG